MPSGITQTLVDDGALSGGAGKLVSGQANDPAKILCSSPGQYTLIGNTTFTWSATATGNFQGYIVSTYAPYPPYPSTSAFANPATVTFNYVP